MSTPQPRHAPEALLDELRAIPGANLSIAAAVRDHHSRGESHHPAALPDAVVFPATNDDVRAVVRACAGYKVPLIPFGAGSSLEGHVNPIAGGISVDMSRMNQVLRVSADDLDATVQAGVTRKQFEKHLRSTGLIFHLDPGADATLGGMAATRASGTTAVRYGTMRDAVLGLTVVMADGRLVTTGGRARKSSTGYDLTKLFVGSEGTLGVITELIVRLHGRPEAVAAATCHFQSIEAAVRTVITTIQLGIPVARIELLDEVQMGAVNKFSKLTYVESPTLFFEFHGLNERDVTEQADAVGEIAAEHGGEAFARAVSHEARAQLWQARHDAYYAALAMRPGSRGWTTDACVPISRLADCIVETKEDVAASHLVAALVGHVGDGNFHLIFPVNPDDPRDLEEAERLSGRLAERAIAMGGTCSGEHGVGVGKMKYLDREHGEALDVMRAIKRTLDPDNIMNPGKLVPMEHSHGGRP